MSRHETPRASRQSLLAADGVLMVTRPPMAAPMPAPGQPGAGSDYVPAHPEVFIAIGEDGVVRAFNGHVDLGTGIKTSLAQIVAEELDIAEDDVDMVLGHTDAAPNQGPTIASSTIQIAAVPLRRAAAQVRHYLLGRAAELLQVDVAQLEIGQGAVRVRGRPDHVRSFGELVAGRQVALPLAVDVALKPASQYRIVGKSSRRVDIPGKATGALVFVHDFRLPGMLHARVVRPPYAGMDCGEFVGKSLISVDLNSVAHIPGMAGVVRDGDFIGVAAEREEHAIQAAAALDVRWHSHPSLPDFSDVAATLRQIPAAPRLLQDRGDAAATMHGAATVVARTFVWPFHMHASIGPSCAVADYRDGHLTVWSGTQNPHVLRIDLGRLLGMSEADIEVVRMEASGCYGRNCADDVSTDAALMSKALGRPVRVQLSRQQEHAWEPKGAAQVIDVKAAIDAAGTLSAYDFTTRYPSNDAPTLTLLLTGKVPATPRVMQAGDRTAVPPYRYPNTHIVCDDVPSIVRAAWLRGVSALPNCFAHESVIDELAREAGRDPVAFRLAHLDDERACDLIRAVAERAAWRADERGSRGEPDASGLLHGRGFAYSRYIHSKFPGFGAAWAAWAVDVEVDRHSGHVRIERIVVGQDTGMMINPDGVRHQIHGNVLQAISRMLKEQVTFGTDAVSSLEWGAYPILTFADVPPVEVVLMDRQEEPPLGAGESATVPGAAAIANALFDATGARFRNPPFTPQSVLDALRGRR